MIDILSRITEITIECGFLECGYVNMEKVNYYPEVRAICEDNFSSIWNVFYQIFYYYLTKGAGDVPNVHIQMHHADFHTYCTIRWKVMALS